MARMSRKKSPTGVYHVVLRGNNKQTIFFDDEDRQFFLNRVKLIREKIHFEIYAYCLMSNHIHMLIKEIDFPISDIFRDLLSSFVAWYNKKYDRVGHLFQERFKSEPVEDDAHFLCAIRYIHKNPVKAGIVSDVGEYKWSSHFDYVSERVSNVDAKQALGIFGGVHEYMEFMRVADDDTRQFIDWDKDRISDEELLALVKEALRIAGVDDIDKCGKDERHEVVLMILKKAPSVSIRQISRVVGISEDKLRTRTPQRGRGSLR